jgi:hypothetical protein
MLKNILIFIKNESNTINNITYFADDNINNYYNNIDVVLLLL